MDDEDGKDACLFEIVVEMRRKYVKKLGREPIVFEISMQIH